jgi:hypothetical protein
VAGLLTLNGAQARYGVAFVRSLSAQAGYGLTETSLDEDVLAIDCKLEAPPGDIRVQVKCTTRAFSKKQHYISYTVQEHWREVWKKNLFDFYFVVVRLGLKPVDKWIAHPDACTQLNAIAYWAKVDPEQIPKAIRVYKANRLNAATFSAWETNLIAKFGGDDAGN